MKLQEIRVIKGENKEKFINGSESFLFLEISFWAYNSSLDNYFISGI